MRKFLIRTGRFSLLIFIPFIFLCYGYFYLDPFKVLYTNNDYSHPVIIPNLDYIATESLMKKKDCNSFILGSSRTIALKPSSWKKYLNENDKPFLFNASTESIYGIYTKLRFLKAQKFKIDNVLILLCRDCTFDHTENFTEHLHIKHPLTSGESKLYFHYRFFKAYLNPKFLFSYYTYLIGGKYRPYMSKHLADRDFVFDPQSNELSVPALEAEIKNNPEAYYKSREHIFWGRKGEGTDSNQRIGEVQEQMLIEIIQMLEESGARYHIILSPLYEQMKFSRQDLEILKSLFGEHLYDFSGKNSYTDSKLNFYESSHFRPCVGDSIMKIIYQEKQLPLDK